MTGLLIECKMCGKMVCVDCLLAHEFEDNKEEDDD